MAETMLVRIAPNNNREVHRAHGLTVRKVDGWCEVSTGTARKLAGERMNALNPASSPPVFEVRSKAEAEAVEAAEKKAADKPGSVAEPKKIAAPPEPPKPVAGKSSKGK